MKIRLLTEYQCEAAISRKMCAPYFLTMPGPIPCTASSSSSFVGAVAAILSSARSPKIRNAGTLLRFASFKRPFGGLSTPNVRWVQYSRSGCQIRFGFTALGNKHDLTDHPSAHEHLMRLSRLSERKSLSDKRFKLLLLQQVKQDDQILTKPLRF